jgi:hypothetical protein
MRWFGFYVACFLVGGALLFFDIAVFIGYSISKVESKELVPMLIPLIAATSTLASRPVARSRRCTGCKC